MIWLLVMKKGSNPWNTYLCNRLDSIETNIRVARTVRLAVIATTIALVGVGKYIFDISLLLIFLAVISSAIWYLFFTVAFFYSDEVIKKYENLILKNIMGKITNDEIYKEYKKIRELEKGWGILILKGRFWRKFIQLN